MRIAAIGVHASRALAVLGLLGSAVGMAEDVKNSADHPLISRFEGSSIVAYRLAEFDEYRLAMAPTNGQRPGANRLAEVEETFDDSNSRHLEGRLTMITYEAPETSSTLQVMRSYEQALTRAGFETLFSCTNRECIGGAPTQPCSGCGAWQMRFSTAIMRRAGFNLVGRIYENQRYMAARLPRPEGDVYVSLYVAGLPKPLAQLDVVEVEPLEAGLVTVDAAAMAREIETTGSVALYGIYFETDKASVTPESQPTLRQIAELLNRGDDLALLVVGHTDNTGTFERNMTLSNERAQAVVAALVSDFGVAASRLTAVGATKYKMQDACDISGHL